jgi:hypothetical protein
MTSSGQSAVDVMVVVGMAYSGSTLLAMLLDQHPDVVSLGEVTGPGHLARPLDEFPCGCGDRLVDCRLWSDIAAEMGAAGHVFSLHEWRLRLDALDLESKGRSTSRVAGRQLVDRSLRVHRIDGARDRLIRAFPPFDRELRDRIARNEAFLDAARRVTGTSTLADSSKDAVRAVRLRRWTDRRILVVHLVRDSPGTIASWVRHRAETGHRASVAGAVRAWERSVAAAERVERAVPAADFVRTRYEDLCRDPVPEVGRLFAAAGLPPHAVEPVVGRGHHVIGNTARLEDPRPIRLDERWREQLSPREIEVIGKRTGATRRRLGYEPI